eukprot:13686990-Alexandrium_andersonii.AAC.1
MSASLVGSEMCIRDRPPSFLIRGAWRAFEERQIAPCRGARLGDLRRPFRQAPSWRDMPASA